MITKLIITSFWLTQVLCTQFFTSSTYYFTAGSDFPQRSEVVTFQSDGPASETACFDLLTDNALECNETFKLSLRFAVEIRGVMVDPNSNETTITIVDDDGMVQYYYYYYYCC